MKCQVGSCNQQACFASGEDRVCGTHWKATLEHRAIATERDVLLRDINAAETVDDLRPILLQLVERSFE